MNNTYEVFNPYEIRYSGNYFITYTDFDGPILDYLVEILTQQILSKDREPIIIESRRVDDGIYISWHQKNDSEKETGV